MKNFKLEFIKKKRVLIPAICVLAVFICKLFGLNINEHSLEDILNTLANLLN